MGRNTGKGELEQQGPLSCEAEGGAFPPCLVGSEGSTDDNSILETVGESSQREGQYGRKIADAKYDLWLFARGQLL